MNESTTVGTVVVTGSSSGIGRAIAVGLLDAGWSVTGLDVSPATLEHARFEALRVDLSDGEDIGRACPQLLTADALVHAAGVLRVGPEALTGHSVAARGGSRGAGSRRPDIRGGPAPDRLAGAVVLGKPEEKPARPSPL